MGEFNLMLAIIPARGGSKGIPNKNIKLLCGKPLISYTIEAAIESNNISEIILSTDSEEIADIASRYDEVKIPFMRPAYLAEDNSLAVDTYLYTIERLRKEFNMDINEFIVLQPTSPLRTTDDIDNAINIYNTKQAKSVIAFSEIEFPLQWVKKIDSEGKITDSVFAENVQGNRQEYEKFYKPNGALFILNYESLKKSRTYYNERTFAYLMPAERSIDIDTNYDLKLAEFLMEKL